MTRLRENGAGRWRGDGSGREPARAEHGATGNRERGAVGEWGEWLDHQYDPGYYTGGRISPLQGGSGGRDGPFGSVLEGTGSLFLLAGLVRLLQGGAERSGALVPCLIGAARPAAGWRPSRGRRR